MKRLFGIMLLLLFLSLAVNSCVLFFVMNREQATIDKDFKQEIRFLMKRAEERDVLLLRVQISIFERVDKDLPKTKPLNLNNLTMND